LAIEIFPPVIPSVALAMNNISNGTTMTNVPRNAICILNFSVGKNSAKRNNIQPADAQ